MNLLEWQTEIRKMIRTASNTEELAEMLQSLSLDIEGDLRKNELAMKIIPLEPRAIDYDFVGNQDFLREALKDALQVAPRYIKGENGNIAVAKLQNRRNTTS